jgi:hypothetical protein
MLERGLRFRNLGFCGHDIDSDLHAPVPIYPEGLAFFPPFREGHGAFVSDQDLALSVRIRDFEPQVCWASGFSWTKVCMLPTPLPRRQLRLMWMVQPVR